MEISVRTNIKELQKKLNAFTHKQLPFATAQALTALVKTVQFEETKSLGSVFDRPTPFTQKAVGIIKARKDTLEAQVFVKDIAAAYLEPYETGGVNKLNSRALLKPVDQPVNQFGNLGRNDIAKLKARSDIFIGKVKTKAGEVDGVWQRVADVANVVSKSGKTRRTTRGINATEHLKLLIRFTDAHKVTQRWNYRMRAELIVQKNFNREMGSALARAVASAK